MRFNVLRFFSSLTRLLVNINNIRLFYFLLLLFFVGACGTNTLVKPGISSHPLHTLARTSANHPVHFPITIQSNMAYGPLSDEQLDLCTPRNAPGTHPGVILIHGGGWQSGNKSFFDNLCKSLAAQGFVAATINYRLAPRYTWPAQLVDAQLAVRWLRVHASQTGLDNRRLCAWGQSAGGHLAVFLGTLATIHPGDEANLLADQSPAVSCVVDAFGPVDLTAPLGASAHSLLLRLFGGVTLQNNRPLYRDASPIFDVSSHSSPTMIIQGTRDTLVLPEQSLELQDALLQQHVFVEYRSYDGAHSYLGLSPRQITAIQAQATAFLIAQENL